MDGSNLYTQIKAADAAISNLPDISQAIKEQMDVGLFTSDSRAFYHRKQEIINPLVSQYDQAVAGISEHLTPRNLGSSESKTILESLSPGNASKLVGYIFCKYDGSTEEDAMRTGETLRLVRDHSSEVHSLLEDMPPEDWKEFTDKDYEEILEEMLKRSK